MRAMPTRRASLILPLIALPALFACSSGESVVPAPLDEAALQAVVARPGVSREKLARAVDALFADEAAESRAVLVLHGSEIVAERYGEGYNPETRFIGWSMSKCV